MEKIIGSWAFIIGVIIALVIGIFSGVLGASAGILTSLLVILGLVVGFLNLAGKDTKDFLLVSTILVIVAFAGGASSTLGNVQYLGPYLSGIFNALLAFVVPATVIVALKEIYYLAQSP